MVLKVKNPNHFNFWDLVKKQIRWQLLTVGSIYLLLLFSCTFKNEEKLEFIQCDTSDITYATVQPIFELNCVRCHNVFQNYFDIRLDSYDNAKAAAQTGYLVKAVNHQSGVVPMPFQLAKLDSCDVKKITIWINNNTPQ